MRKFVLWIFVAAVGILSASSLQAQEFAGDWQASIKDGTDLYRLSLHVAKSESCGWERAREGGMMGTSCGLQM